MGVSDAVAVLVSEGVRDVVGMVLVEEDVVVVLLVRLVVLVVREVVGGTVVVVLSFCRLSNTIIWSLVCCLLMSMG